MYRAAVSRCRLGNPQPVCSRRANRRRMEMLTMASSQAAWTLEQLHRLPDDGNKYELVQGQLFVTPAPGVPHQNIIAVLNRILLPYVERWKLGCVHQARAIVRHAGSEVEPDMMVRPLADPAEH